MTRCLCLNGINIGLLATRKSRRTAVAFVMHAYIHTYNIHTYIPTVLPSRSFTTSFVFPSFSDHATTFETHYWKKLTCGVIRSFNFLLAQVIYAGKCLVCRERNAWHSWMRCERCEKTLYKRTVQERTDPTNVISSPGAEPTAE